MNNDKVNDIINYENYKVEGLQARKYYIVACISLFLIVYLFYMNLVISFCMIFIAIPLKKKYIQFKIKQQKDSLRQQFRDLLYSLASSITAGRQMSEALIEANKNLNFIYDEKEPIMIELEYITKSIKESRSTDEMLLKDFAYRSGIEEIISFADIYSTCRSTGANVGEMISKAADILIDKMAIDREIKAITAQKKIEAKIISSMPIVILIFLNIVSPGYLHSLYHTFLGHMIMTVALIIMVVSYYVMGKIVEVKV